MEPISQSSSSTPLPNRVVDIHEYEETTLAMPVNKDFIMSAVELNQFILANFEVVSINITAAEIDLDITKIEVIIIGEIHGEETHARLNAKIVNSLWEIHQGNILVLTEDGAKAGHPVGQARFINKSVIVEHWDTEHPDALEKASRELHVQALNGIDSIKNLQEQINKIILDKLSDREQLQIFQDKAGEIANLFSQLSTSYVSLVKNTQKIRDETLQKNLHTARAALPPKRNITVIVGHSHLNPNISYLKLTSIPALGLSPKQDIEQSNTNVKINKVFDLDAVTVSELQIYINRELKALIDTPLNTTIDSLSVCQGVAVLARYQIFLSLML